MGFPFSADLDDEVTCPECEGTGHEDCIDCAGTGECCHCDIGPCPDCQGSGRVDCQECDGHKFVPKEIG